MDTSGLKRIERTNYVLGGIATVVCAVTLDRSQTLGILVGSLLGSVNFTLIRRIVEQWMTGAENEGSHSSHKSAYFMIPKMTGLVLAVFLCLRFLPISGAFFAIGFSVFLVSIMLETVHTLFRPAHDLESGDGETNGEGTA